MIDKDIKREAIVDYFSGYGITVDESLLKKIDDILTFERFDYIFGDTSPEARIAKLKEKLLSLAKELKIESFNNKIKDMIDE